jgi:maltose alpha-D-glucosyltransferase/alpha-amylase
MKKLVIALLLMPMIVVQAQYNGHKFRPAPGWLKTAAFYQIYPQSFKDTNGDGIGDIAGITQKLDYLKWLGIDAIWLNPCFESMYQDAGYDVTDFYKVAARYGTNDDLKKLFAEAHKRKMRVCLDLVAGHTSIDHPWFQQSQLATPNEFTDRYIWTNDSTIKPDRHISGKFERNGTYRKNFFDCQPALNYGFGKPDPAQPWQQPVTAPGPQATRKELMKIMDFWMNMGCDGFRVDMAPSLIKNDPDRVETNKLWAEIRNHFQDRYPEGILIAEWGNPGRAITAGFMMDFIIHLGNNGYSSMFFNKVGTYRHDTCYFELKGEGTPTKFVNYYLEQLKVVGDSGYICVPTANHDFQRLNCGPRNTEDQLRVAMTFLMTIPGVPLYYYGDEIGMKFIDGLPSKEGSQLTKGNRAGSRTPMQWDASAGAGFSTGDISQYYLPIDSDPNRPNVATQLKDKKSFIYFNRQLLAFRKKYPALGTLGKIDFIYAKENTYPLAYTRSLNGKKFLIVLNPSGKQTLVNLGRDYQTKRLKPLIVKNLKFSAKTTDLMIESDALSYGIFEVL